MPVLNIRKRKNQNTADFYLTSTIGRCPALGELTALKIIKIALEFVQ